MSESDARDQRKAAGGRLSVRVGLIRDGTSGISLSVGEKLIGEWTDSRAKGLLLTPDTKVAILGADGGRLYLFSVPGSILSGEQISDTEVAVIFELTE